MKKDQFSNKILLFCIIFLSINANTFAQDWTWKKGTNTGDQLGIYGTQGVPAPANNPGSRLASNNWIDGSGNLWLFGGTGFPASGPTGALNDLWKYNPATNEWTYVKGSSVRNQFGTYGTQGVSAPANKPGGRYNAVTWIDASGNLWLFGGTGYAAATVGYLNDLWKYNPVTNEWTWIKGTNLSDQNGTYGTQGISAPANIPGGRRYDVSWTDAAGNFWLFGGDGFPASGAAGLLNDLWRYNPTTNEWTWMKGSNLANQNGTYGTQGISAPLNTPGARSGPISWTDGLGNLWMHGGSGYPAVGVTGYLNDLWKYNIISNEWTWMKGANVINQNGIYGTQGVSDLANAPGGVYAAVSWIDPLGSLWMSHGTGYPSSGPAGYLHDLWKYNPGSNEWTWIKGTSLINQNGVYGTQGVSAPTNIPGCLYGPVSWTDALGNLWSFGGFGYPSAGGPNRLNALWQYGNCTIPSTPASISGTTTICSGSSNTYFITDVPGATSYTWTLPSGWSGTSTTNSINTTASATSGNITVTANNACGASSPQTLAITVNSIPSTPGTISGTTTICSGSSNTYSVTNDPSAASYTWTLPGGWSGTSTTNSINTTASATSGNITVTANNACGNSSPQTLAITVNTIPSTPGTISGTTTICSGSSNTYSVTNDPTVTSYTWTLPGGWTGTSTTNSINTTASTTSGNITVTANNACGSSSPQTLAITVNTIPSTPSTISGSTTICSGSSNTYSVTNDPSATSYTWTLPGGWSGTSTTNSINTTASTTSGNITVTANNACGNSSPQTLAITVNTIPSTPGTISGTSTICSGSSNTYSVTNDPSATSYTWTLPGGWSGTSTTNSINTTASSTSGNITVTANNACGNSSPQTLAITVNTAPSTPGTISGLTTICSGSSNTYSVTNDPSATSYTWTLPGGWSGTSTTNSINTTASATSGNITVTANNACGNSSPQTVAITVNTAPSTPGTISGSASICDGSSNTYSVTNDPTATSYTWTLPSGWSGASTTNSINTTASSTSGNITVTANNSCGNSSQQTLSITVNPLPTVNFNYTGQDTVCINYALQALSGGTPSGGTYSGTGVTGTNFDPNAAGLGAHNITYSFTDGNSCTNTDLITITVIGCAGIEDNNNATITVYPNPFTNSISLSGIIGSTEVRLYNALGEMLGNWLITEGNNTINTESLRSGMYFLNFGTTTKKIIKQ